MPGWELALDLGALDVPKPAPEGPAFRAGHPDEKKPHDSHDPFSEAGQAGGEEADKHSKQRAVLAALTRAAKRMRLATDSPGLRFPRPQTTAELMKMSKMEFWATVSRWDASTFAARIHDGKEIRDRALLNRLKDCFGRKDSLKAFEETAKNILEHLTEKKYGNLLHEAENAAWDGRTVGDVMKGGGRGIAGRALRSVQKLEQAASDAPSFVTRMISKVAGFAKDLFGKVEGAISGLAETLEHAEQPWIRNAVKFVESLLAPAKEMFQTLGSRAGGWLESLKTIGGKFKTLAGRVFEFLGPWATRLAFLADVWSWTRGPRTLAERTKDHEIKEDLERNDGKADLIANLYYGPNILADLVSVVGTFVPVVKPAGFVADLFNIAWGGIEVGWGRWKMSWGGVGLPLMDTLATKLARKRRGSSRFDDEDEELGRIYERILAREGKEPGISLDISTKYRLERILGHELGEVRIHQGPLASNLAKATEADAFTVGSDIYVPGSLDLSSPEGLGLLVHEATHVAQLGAATPVSSPRSLGGGASGAVMEDVARSVEARFLSRARSRHPIMAEPAHREEPAPSIELAALEAPAPLASAPREKAVQRQAKGSKHEHFDPVSNVMRAYKVRSTVSQEEFLELCTERLMNLLREELTLDSERRESVRWNDNLPSP
ncbi:DUF4157 domain-containing protein [bacterium]|nr:DUF4157 domain-containing protein [bacterium]